MEIIVCPACGVENQIVRNECEKCGADLSVIKSILNNANKHYNAALELAKEGRNDEAAVELKAAIELWGKNPNFHNLLGTVYARRGLYDLATKSWEAALALDPLFEKAYRSIEKARKVELHLHHELQQRPFKMMAALAGLVAVVAIVVLVVLGVRLRGSQKEVDRLTSELTSKPASGEVDQLRLALSLKEKQATNLETQLSTAQQESQSRQEQITQLQEKVQQLENRPPLTADEGTLKELAGRIEELQKENEQLAQQAARDREEASKIKADLARSQEQIKKTQNESKVLGARLQEAAVTADVLKSREAQVKSALDLWQQGKYKELLFVLDQMEKEEYPPVLVEDLRGRAKEQIALLEDPLYRARQQAAAEAARAQEQEERAYYAGLKMDQAKALAQQENWQGAEVLLREALEIDPAHEAAQSLLVEVRGKIAGREQVLAERLRSAQVALGTGRFDEAIEGFQAVLAARPGDETAQAGLKAAQESKANAKQAETERQRRIATLSQQASQAAEAGKVEEALQLYRQWRQSDPDNRTIDREVERIQRKERERIDGLSGKFTSGRRNFDEGDYERSIQDFESALALARLPEERERVQQALDIVHQSLGERRRAEQEREKAFASAYKEAGDLYRDGILDKALEKIDNALKIHPDHRDARRLKRSIESALEKQKSE